MNIKQASEQSGVSAPNIRFYEKEGLLTPARRQGNAYRDYTAGDIRTLKLIRMLRMLDVPLPVIQRVLNGEQPLSAAADFAAKEAFLKAAGTGLREPFSLCEIEAVRLPGGAPAYHFSGRSAKWVEARRLRAHLSLSHEDGMAMAYCILETET